MHAELDYDVGPKLQRTMRHSKSDQSSLRAQIILQSGLGVEVENLAREFNMEPDAIRALIVDFNVRRIKAISRKRPARRACVMDEEDRAIIEELIRLTPRAFDLPDNRWLLPEILAYVKQHHLVNGIDEQWIAETLEARRRRRSFT